MRLNRFEKIVTAIALFVIVAVPIKVLAMDGNFSLRYSENHTSNSKNLSYPIPYVNFYNDNLSTDGELAISIMKKFLFGYELKARSQEWVTNKQEITFYYGSFGKGTYKVVFVANKINSGSSIAGRYFISSRE